MCRGERFDTPLQLAYRHPYGKWSRSHFGVYALVAVRFGTALRGLG